MDKLTEILIVDDNQELALNLCEILELGGYNAETVFCGADALEKCKSKSFDLALVDIRLPDIQGNDLIPKMNEILPEIRCIIMTAHATIETAASAVGKNGIVAYEIKPLDINRLLFLVNEILARIQAEKALLESEAYTRALVGSVQAGIFVVDEEHGLIMDANPAAAAMARINKDELAGQPYSRFIASDHSDRLEEETTLSTTLGDTVEILKTSTTATLKGKPCSIKCFLDISEIKRMSRELQIAKEQAEAAIQARKEFLSQMNSEIRTPMASVMGSIDSLLNLELGDEQRKYAEHINDCFESILTILNDIIDLHGAG